MSKNRHEKPKLQTQKESKERKSASGSNDFKNSAGAFAASGLTSTPSGWNKREVERKAGQQLNHGSSITQSRTKNRGDK